MPLLTLDLPETSEPLSLGLQLPDGVCELAPATRAAGGLTVSEPVSAVADWAKGQGSLVAVVAGAVAACEGGPRVTALTVPDGGWAIGLSVAPLEVRVDGVALAEVVPLGDDHAWWHVPAKVATVAFVLPDGLPPSLFALTPDPTVLPPPGWVVTVPQGEARDTAALATPVVAALEPPGVAAVVELEGRVVVVGLQPGASRGQLREGDAAPHAVFATVTPPAGLPTAVTVRPGRARRFTLDGEGDLTSAVVVDAEVATVVVDGPRQLRVEALRQGVTTVVLRRTTGALDVVTVLVSR
jgi:hypothetical protein